MTTLASKPTSPKRAAIVAKIHDKARAIRMIRDWPLSETDREKIFSGNALKLLNMTPASMH